MGVDPYGIAAMTPKARHVNLLIKSQPCKIANILKQEMLSLGGDAAVARGSVSCSIEKTDVLLMGTRKQIAALTDKLARQPFGMSALGKEIERVLVDSDCAEFVWRTSRREISLHGQTKIMGILNVTPDSFSDGNRYLSPAKALDAALKMADEGADIIDIGGESTRPGSKPVSAEEESQRVLPVVEAVSARISLPLSIDTSKAVVAAKALNAGAEIINDISSFEADTKMADVARRAKAGVILMHMRGTPENMQARDLHYIDLMEEIQDVLVKAVLSAENAGIARQCLAVDPGIGFGKSADDNLRILKNLPELKSLGLPIVVGTSRKSFIGAITGEEPPNRLEGTAATVSAAISGGCQIVRVHDVAAMKKVVAVTDKILRA